MAQARLRQPAAQGVIVMPAGKRRLLLHQASAPHVNLPAEPAVGDAVKDAADGDQVAAVWPGMHGRPARQKLAEQRRKSIAEVGFAALEPGGPVDFQALG